MIDRQVSIRDSAHRGSGRLLEAKAMNSDMKTKYSCRSPRRSLLDALLFSLVVLIHQEIARLTEEEDGPPPFRQVFEAADHRGLGTLPPLAFRRCLLEGLGLDLTEAECEALLEYLVRDVVVRKQSRSRMGA